MTRCVLLTLLLSGCGANCGQFQSTSDLCDFPYGVGPDFTAGECAPSAVCLPSSVAPCSGNACCHAFCASTICPNESPCITLTPSQFPDGGVIAESNCGCLDGGQCTCDDAGCMESSCLDVCSSAT